MDIVMSDKVNVNKRASNESNPSYNDNTKESTDVERLEKIVPVNLDNNMHNSRSSSTLKFELSCSEINNNSNVDDNSDCSDIEMDVFHSDDDSTTSDKNDSDKHTVKNNIDVIQSEKVITNLEVSYKYDLTKSISGAVSKMKDVALVNDTILANCDKNCIIPSDKMSSVKTTCCVSLNRMDFKEFNNHRLECEESANKTDSIQLNSNQSNSGANVNETGCTALYDDVSDCEDTVNEIECNELDNELLEAEENDESNSLFQKYLSKEKRKEILSYSEHRLNFFSPYINHVLENKISTMPYWVFYKNSLKFRCFVCLRYFGLRNDAMKHLWLHLFGKCLFCDVYLIRTEQVFKNHMETRHHLQIQKDKLHCSLCEKKFVDVKKFIEHYKNHYQHPCNYCTKQLESTDDLLRHLKSCHNNLLENNCFDCSLFYQTGEKMLKHLKNISKLGFVCKNCKLAFHCEKQLEIHYKIFGEDHNRDSSDQIYTDASKNVQIEENNEKQMIVLDVQNFKKIIQFFNDILSKKITLDQLYTNKLTVKSKRGNTKMLSATSIECPVTRCKRNLPLDNKKKFFKHIQNHLLTTCYKCKQIFRCGEYYKLHLQSSKVCSSSSFSCYLCKVDFKNIKEYMLHYHLHVRSRICPICNLIVSSKEQMLKHRRSHIEMKTIMCEYCSKMFLTQDELKSHVRNIHSIPHETNSLINLCSECGSLKKHKQGCSKLKTLQKEFICDYCSKVFKSKIQIINHIMNHMNLKPYKCKVCNKTFGRQTSLDKHQKDMHAVRPWVCSNQGCKSAFSFKSGLQTHLTVCCQTKDKTAVKQKK